MEEKVGKVKSVRITRSGLVIVECKDRDQAKKAMKIRSFNKCRVEVFFLGGKRRKMGVISGVPLTVKPQQLMDVEGVCEIRRLTKFNQGKKVDAVTVCVP